MKKVVFLLLMFCLVSCTSYRQVTTTVKNYGISIEQDGYACLYIECEDGHTEKLGPLLSVPTKEIIGTPFTYYVKD